MIKIIVIMGLMITLLCSLLWFQITSVAELRQQLTLSADVNQELQKSLNLRDLSCKIDNEVVSEYQAEKKAQQDKVQDAVSKIESLPKKPIQVSSKVIAKVQQDAEIDIDSPLPDSIIVLLRESCVQGEGDACIPTR